MPTIRGTNIPRGCVTLAGIFVAIAIALGIAISTSGGDDQNEVATQQQSERGPSDQGQKCPDSATQSLGSRDVTLISSRTQDCPDDAELKFYRIEFVTPAACVAAPPAVRLVQPPGEVRVTGNTAVELYFGWSEGNTLGHPVGTIYLSDTTTLDEDGGFEAVNDGGGGIIWKGKIDGDSISGTMHFGFENDPASNPCHDVHPFTGERVDSGAQVIAP